MTGAKLSGALLVRKESRTATMPAQNLSAILHDAEEKARGGPVLVWSARPDDEAEPNAAEDAGDAVHCAAEAPQATDFDPPAVRGPAHRWTVFRAAIARESDNRPIPRRAGFSRCKCSTGHRNVKGDPSGSSFDGRTTHSADRCPH